MNYRNNILKILKEEILPGESKTINFNLTEKELGFYDNSGNFVTEPGIFKIMVGGSSDKGIFESFELK